MREFIRHPVSVPIRVNISKTESEIDQLQDISEGGLCLRSRHFIPPRNHVHLEIDVCRPQFEAEGTVVWCRRCGSAYDVGVRFDDEDTRFAMRMVEQMCHIEQYRKEVAAKEGRHIDAETAAAEWIEKYAADFPR